MKESSGEELRQKRVRSRKLVITFPNTAAAMAMESRASGPGGNGRLIPVPKEISAGCGLAWCAAPEKEASLKELMGREQIPYQGLYFLDLY